MGKAKRETALWAVLTQGGLASLGVYLGGLLGLAWLVSSGRVGEGRPWILALGAVSSFVGGMVTGRRTPWSSLVSALVTAAIFALALSLAGLALWGEVALPGAGLALWGAILGGGLLAGMARRRKKGRRVRR